jgi:hypothetical protein
MAWCCSGSDSGDRTAATALNVAQEVVRSGQPCRGVLEATVIGIINSSM